MPNFKGRFERLELKYLIDEFAADRIRSSIRPYCRPDRYNGGTAGDTGKGRGQHPGYGVRSLYLDSPGLALFRAKERGDSERVKLRVRTYVDSPGNPILEIKRRVSDIVHKTRARVQHEEVEGIARGRVPASSDSRVENFLNDFALHSLRSGAQPTLWVDYDREAYTSDVDTYARVTFDRQISARRTDAWDFDAGSGEDSCRFDDHRSSGLRARNVVLELKCESFVPSWITSLIQTHALKRQSFSKYGIGIYLTGQRFAEASLPRRSVKALA
jgi:hypothetical protein